MDLVESPIFCVACSSMGRCLSLLWHSDSVGGELLLCVYRSFMSLVITPNH